MSLVDGPAAEREYKRTFGTGATRDTDIDKFDYEGFLCPITLERYARYMHKNRQMQDGSIRDSDNWQKGIPINQYIKSLMRHTFSVWKQIRGYKTGTDLQEDLCAIIFNAMGILHELLKKERIGAPSPILKAPSNSVGKAPEGTYKDLPF